MPEPFDPDPESKEPAVLAILAIFGAALATLAAIKGNGMNSVTTGAADAAAVDGEYVQ